ncbi:hypothetical protein C8Q76DRAFT_810107 [Earliella scabrosa]|nr:hypothetical protein C8Q76DRAFT_810107 [Earliella scabrosa]
MQEEETRCLMLRFLRDPRNFYRHPREPTGAESSSASRTGMLAKDDQDQDPLVRVVEIAMQGFAKASEPDAFLVNYILPSPYATYLSACYHGEGSSGSRTVHEAGAGRPPVCVREAGDGKAALQSTAIVHSHPFLNGQQARPESSDQSHSEGSRLQQPKEEQQIVLYAIVECDAPAS